MSSPLLPVDDYVARVAELIGPPQQAAVELTSADGLILAEDLVALVDLPGFDNSAMDGYAVRHADVAAASEQQPVRLPVSDDIPAGPTDLRPLQAQTAARIMTGSPVPPEADTVVQVEWTDAAQTGPAPTEIRVFRAPGLGQNIRRRAEEARAGDVVLPAGTELTPPGVSLAAALGHATLPAFRRPRVVVLSTGSELVGVGEPLRPGQIYESNSHLLVPALRRVGADARALRLVDDDVERFRQRMLEAAEGADLIITSGGVSAGAFEVVKEALTLDGGVEFVKVGMQPGMPQGCGRIGDTPIVTLPGNPVSVFVSFEVFVRPPLRGFLGHPDTERPGFVGTWAGGKQPSPVGKRQFLRGHCDVPEGTVTPVGAPPSHLLASLAKANCLVVVPEDAEAVAPGDEVEIWLLDPL